MVLDASDASWFFLQCQTQPRAHRDLYTFILFYKINDHDYDYGDHDPGDNRDKRS